MNTGQMMIGIVAMALVTIVTLNLNRGSITTQDSLIYNKSFILATTVAQSILDEIQSKEFDEEVVKGTKIYSADDFSELLKKDAGENYPNFDDVDDYNGFTKIDTIAQMGIFKISVAVNYLTDDLANTNSPTYNKNVTINITSPSLINFYTEKEDTVVISSLFSQWTLL